MDFAWSDVFAIETSLEPGRSRRDLSCTNLGCMNDMSAPVSTSPMNSLPLSFTTVLDLSESGSVDAMMDPNVGTNAAAAVVDFFGLDLHIRLK